MVVCDVHYGRIERRAVERERDAVHVLIRRGVLIALVEKTDLRSGYALAAANVSHLIADCGTRAGASAAHYVVTVATGASDLSRDARLQQNIRALSPS